MKTVTIYGRLGFRLIATDCYYAFEWDGKPQLDPRPVRLQDGSNMCPGERFRGFDGKKTSAGFPGFHLSKGSLEYCGAYDGLDGTYYLFRRIGYGRTPPNFYYGFRSMGDGSFFFSTPGCAGRVVETRIVERAG